MNNYNQETFEKWAATQTLPRINIPLRNFSKRDDDSYYVEEIDMLWDAWKASREALDGRWN